MHIAIYSQQILNASLVIGYTIPKGWKVFASFRAVHLNPEYYKDARTFNPWRWQVLQSLLLSSVSNKFLFLSLTSECSKFIRVTHQKQQTRGMFIHLLGEGHGCALVMS